MPLSPPADYAPPAGPLQILHCDDALLAVSKPPGLLSVPGRDAALGECLMSQVQAIFPQARLVHRLDRDTSGVAVFAMTAAAQRHLGLQFEKRIPRKTYIAEVAGVPRDASGWIDQPLRADWPNRPRQMVDPVAGRAAQTGWAVIARKTSSAFLRLSPRTGRSHQLRVHLQWLGHPILGDPIYAPETLGRRPRLMLHAAALALRHPLGGAWIAFRAPSGFVPAAEEPRDA